MVQVSYDFTDCHMKLCFFGHVVFHGAKNDVSTEAMLKVELPRCPAISSLAWCAKVLEDLELEAKAVGTGARSGSSLWKTTELMERNREKKALELLMKDCLFMFPNA